ncbi:MAG: hypothetical protein OEY80_01980, partial [Nitrospirota bacterium]|nr:hypothetical protein [Nitrospirota bacterium]
RKAKTLTKVISTTKAKESDKKAKPGSKKSTPAPDVTPARAKGSLTKKTTAKSPGAPSKVSKAGKPAKETKAVAQSKKSGSKAKKGATSDASLETLSAAALNVVQEEPLLPDDIDTELDIEVEDVDGGITLESLTADLADESDDLDVDDLDDDFVDDDFAEDLADEADEDLDLTEDLSEELGPEKYFRDTEVSNDDDEETILRSW